MTRPASQLETPHSTTHAWLQAAGLLAIAALALYLRTLATDSPFTSADHIMIAYRTTCEPGWRWCFQNHYGPLQPLLTKLFALAVTGLGVPMTETLWRLPMGVVGAIVPLLAFALARRVGGSAMAVWFAAIWTAVLPPLVTDARYMWAYETLGTALALVAVLVTFAYMDRPTRGRSWIAGILLAAYLQSHLHVYAVPCVVLLILLFDRFRTDVNGGDENADTPSRPHCSSAAADSGTRCLSAGISRVMRTPGLWLPSVISVCVLIAAWKLIGGGPFARVITKTSGAPDSPDRLSSALNLARAWLGHVGWPVAVLVAATLVLPRIVRIFRPGIASSVPAPRRTWLLGAWIMLFVGPLFILGFRTGRPTQYLTQATAVLAVLTPVLLFSRQQNDTAPPIGRLAFCTLIAAWLLLGTVDANFYTGRYSQRTGVTAAWGAAVPNAGYKTAGWYVRKHVPADDVIFTLHDTSGLERPVAEYYFGRACLASEDLTAVQSFALCSHFETAVDVIVDDVRVSGVRPDSWTRNFAPAAVISDGHRPLVRILMRGTANTPPLDLRLDSSDRLYDAEFGPREIGRPPPNSARMPHIQPVRAFLRTLR